MKKIICLMILLMGLATFLAGCKKEEEKETEHEAITIMDAQRDYRELIKLVNEKYPEIKIEIVPYRGRNISAYCKQQLEAGRLPDIYTTTQAWSGDLLKENLLDLSHYDVTKKYNQARIEDYVVDGGLYLLPFDYSITGITYNKTLFEKNNITVPTSFKELRDVTIPKLKSLGIDISATLLDLPGSAFQYFFNVSSTIYMNSIEGRKWRDDFSNIESNVYASDNENVNECIEYFKEWVDCGIISYDANVSNNSSAVLNKFYEGNTAFLIGSIVRFSQNDDGSGDQYALMPYLSEDGTSNMYITSPAKLYGLNKELGASGNEQKLQDALHILEVMSSNEGYLAINGENSTNMCSIKDFNISSDSVYLEASKLISKGYSMDLVYTGWDNYLVPFGEKVASFVKGECSGKDALLALDNTKKDVQEKGVTYYATVTEELNTVQAAQLSGQMFLEATNADLALISYNVYNPNVHALMENSYGANGNILKGYMTDEYITIFLPTGWYDHLFTASLTGAKIKEMVNEGCDTRATGFHYPYVLLSKDGKQLDDSKTYTVVLCGYNKKEKESYNLVDTGIVGLDAAKAYLLKIKEISSKTLQETYVLAITSLEE